MNRILSQFWPLALTAALYSPRAAAAEIERLVTIGDSYTIGEGVAEQDRWPNQLVASLRRKGTQIEIASNPSQTGWTVNDALHREVEALDSARATVVTVLVGVNDQVQGSTAVQFSADLSLLLDRIQQRLVATNCNPRRILLLTIPDYSLTPTGKNFEASRQATTELASFNREIAKQAAERGLAVADIAPIAASNANLTTSDGLHPSGEQYRLWAESIEREFTKLLAHPSCHPR